MAILTADKVLAAGSTADIYTMIDKTIRASFEARYQNVVSARVEAARLNTVEMYRERVEAELMFENMFMSTTLQPATPEL